MDSSHLFMGGAGDTAFFSVAAAAELQRKTDFG